MPLSGQSKDFIRSEDLDALSKARSDQSPIFSLYLGLGSGDRSGDVIGRFNHLLRQVEQQKRLDHASPAYREQWNVEADQIRRWLETERLPQSSGVALFSGTGAGLWQVIPLPERVCDLLVAADRAHTRPLEILLSEQANEQSSEAQRVQEVISKAQNGAGGVLGPEQTFLAVRAKMVRLLVVEEDFCMPGGECPNCGFIGSDEGSVCLLCGVALRPEQNVVEVALKRVLDAGGEIEILRSAESRRALELHGRIGGLVRTDRKAPEKDTANRQPFEKDGKTNKDVLHDETIEESFPASDPPG